MSSIARTDGIIEFSYYNQRSQRETIKLKQGENGALLRVSSDAEESALYRLDGCAVSSAPIPCENYNDIKHKIAETPNTMVGWNTVFHESFDLMKEYYSGEKTCEDIKNYIRGICRCNTSGETGKEQAAKTLSLAYEYMSRANSRNAVSKNMDEGERFIVDTGLRSDAGNIFSNMKGVVYYNADHYHACEKAQKIFKETISELSREYGISEPDYSALESSNRFPDGGVTYNSVWNHETYNENIIHHINEFKFIDDNFVPDANFLFCEAELKYDESKNVEEVGTNIKRYLMEKLGKGFRAGDNLILEAQRQKMQNAGEVIKAKSHVRHYFDEYGIKYQNVRDVRWTADYFGLLLY